MQKKKLIPVLLLFIGLLRQNDTITRSTTAPVASTVYVEKVWLC
jgi:multisubunit Na+/H+ antiporter MnhG subunit